MKGSQLIEQWQERDLTDEAARGVLAPAFEVDAIIESIAGLISAGRYPVLTGDGGVGKTALISEAVRRAHAGAGPAELHGKRVLEFSLRQRLSAVGKPKQLGAELHKLVGALIEARDEIVPFFSDFHLAYRFDFEPQFLRLAARFNAPILAEGDRSIIDSMFELTPEFEQYYSLVHLDEPTPDRMQAILEQWVPDQARRNGKKYSPLAVKLALGLAHRFLTRNRLPRSVLELLGQLGAPRGETVTERHVIDRFCATQRVPRTLIDPALPLALDDLESELSSRVLGQAEAVQAVVRMIGLVKAGLADVRRPFGVFLFVGPTGVGKTHIAHTLAEYLFGGRDRLIRLNMADYADDSGAGTLFGWPEESGWRGQGQLTKRLVGQPLAVLLLDEFEKAKPAVHDRFLQLFDEGSFVNGAGQLVSCRSTIIIATSNAGAEIYRERAFGFGPLDDLEAKDAELDRRLEQHFRFELLNRFDQVVHFHPLSREDIRTIALRELEQIKSRGGLEQRGLVVEVDEAVLDWLVIQGYDADHGARFLRRTIERNASTALAEAIVRHNPPDGAHIGLSVRQNRVFAQILDRGARAAPKRAPVTLPLGTGEQTRKLDRDALGAEADRLLAAAGPLFAGLEEKRSEHGRILTEMNDAGFWDRGQERQRALDRFRELDVTIRAEERVARPLVRLDEFRRRDATSPPRKLEWLAEAVEAAARALRDWNDRCADEGAGAVWIAVSNADPLHSGGRWIEELVEMELRWCHHLHLTARVVAFELNDDELARVVLEADGPGAHAFLRMEAGVHRFCKRPKRDSRCRVDVVPKGVASSDGRSGIERVQRRRRARYGIKPVLRARLADPRRGVTIELLGDNEATLTQLLRDLEHEFTSGATDPPETARVYNEDGSGARDPRSGAVIPHLREVLRGSLDRFLEEWRRSENHAGSDA